MLEALDLDPGQTHFRGILWDGARRRKADPMAQTSWPVQGALPGRLEQLQRQGCNLYAAPNGGPKDEHVSACRIVFAEWDDVDRGELEQRLEGWRASGLPLWTVKLETWSGGSIHVHWKLAQPIAPDRWRVLVRRLAEVLASDPTCCNPSRVMRLAGSSYWGKAGKPREGQVLGVARLLEAHPQATTTADELEAWLATVEAVEAAPLLAPAASSNGTAPPRTLAELERLLGLYPQILPDNGQRAEALKLGAAFCAAWEDSGGSRVEALAVLQRHSPGAIDSFEQGAADLDRVTAASFFHLCKLAGADVTRQRAASSRQQPPRADAAAAPQGAPQAAPATAEAKLAALTEKAAQLLEARAPFAARVPMLRAEAEALGLTIRDPELEGILKAARRRRTHGEAADMLTPGDRLDLTPDPWGWDRLILRGTLNLLVALPKQGKTSLLLAMLAAWHRHDLAFLDRTLCGPCPPVLIVGTDQGQADWGRMLQGIGWCDEAGTLGRPIVGLFHAGRPLHLDPEGIDRIAAIAQQHPGLLVVVDSLHACVAPLGLKEESPAIAEPIADLMEQLDPHGATVVLIHHASKGRAGEGASSASRGSTALPALASQILKLAPANPNNAQDRRRVLTTEGRGGLPEALVIQREGATWELLGGEEMLRQEQTAADALAKLSDRQADALAFVVERWQEEARTTAADLVVGLGLGGADPSSSALRTLQQLERKGLLTSRKPDRRDEISGRPAFEFRPAAMAATAYAGARAGDSLAGMPEMPEMPETPSTGEAPEMPETPEQVPLAGEDPERDPFSVGVSGIKGISGIPSGESPARAAAVTETPPVTETPRRGFPSSASAGNSGAIGSGADAFGDLDDPHWPKRASAA